MPGQNLGGVCNCLSYVLGKRLADTSFEFPSGPITRVSTVEEESIQNDGSDFMAMMGDSDATYADGVYEGTGEGGMGGNITVEVTVEDGKVTAITYNDNETPSIGGEALPQLVEQAIAANGAVDGVSGATLTTTAFQAAVADALSKAAM
jgi:uncharacterized protein with FMN-binding domain